ncbi:hypothetical protein IMSAGC006_00795 [Muribaculaceae bacterium]|nr:hypothetical protein IMSAGC006_00795 [Muribaculaceae bacterium]
MACVDAGHLFFERIADIEQIFYGRIERGIVVRNSDADAAFGRACDVGHGAGLHGHTVGQQFPLQLKEVEVEEIICVFYLK